MLFSSYEFLVFLAVVLVLAQYFKGRSRNHVLLVASYAFYASWNPYFLSLLMFSTCLDFLCGGQIAKSSAPGRRKAYLAASLVGNLGVLSYFKYGNFFMENIALVSGVDATPFYLNVIIPLGISFYTFQSMSYTIDMYRGASDPYDKLLDFALYVTFFPQLIAGPILRAGDFKPQLSRTEPVREDEMLKGVELFFVGLFKKVVIADNLGRAVDPVFASPDTYSGASILLASTMFWVQIYCDFSGYSTMARGVASLFGFHLPRNFNFPILAYNPLVYRRSWHITMGNWFTDYVYKPLGGSRVGDLRYAANIMITWTALGLWHGASWNFIGWGAYNGAILAVYAVFMRRKTWSLPVFPGKRILGWMLNAPTLIFSALLFRSHDMSDFQIGLGRVVTWADGKDVATGWFISLAGLFLVHLICFRWYREEFLQNVGWVPRVLALSAGTILIALLASSTRPFMYFQF